MKVTPWEVKGKVDYDKLIREFGTSKLDEKLVKEIDNEANDVNVMIRRGVFFSHRDLDKILLEYKKGKGFFLYTGRGPSADMHIGHLLAFELTKWLQEKFGVNVYIQITDDEKFLSNKDKEFEEIQKYANENILDILAVGFDEDKTFVFKNTEYVKNVFPLMTKAAKKITFSTAKAVFGFNNETNVGMIYFPTYQIIPTFFEKKRCLIPCAIDQDPYWRIQRDIAENLGYLKAAAIHGTFLPPLQGVYGKMSSSEKLSAIFLSDDESTVEKKIKKYAYSGGRPTIEEHREKGANLEVDIAYKWLYMFFEQDDNKMREIAQEYGSGKMLTGEIKQILIEKLNKYLNEHRKRKKLVEKKKKNFMYDGKLAKKMWEKIYY